MEGTNITRRNLCKAGGFAVAGVLGMGTLASCAASAKEDLSNTGADELTFSAGHEREGLPSFFQMPEPISDIADTKEYDVVVVGAGASGVAAALSACEGGATVALLQKESTAISQGMGGGGIVLSESDPAAIEAMISEIVKDNGYRSKRSLIEQWAKNSGEAIQWYYDKAVEGEGPVSLDPIPLEFNGRTVQSIVYGAGPKPLGNNEVVQAVAAVAEKEGVDIFYSTPAKMLVQDAGAVKGVIADSPEGYVRFNANKGVVMATGDYQNDEQMSNYYHPELRYFTRKQINKTGDGQKMIVWAGGVMEAPTHTKMLHDYDASSIMLCDAPFLCVKMNGQRYTNEETPMDCMNNFLGAEEDGGRYVQVFDANYQTQGEAWGGIPVDPEGMKRYMPEENDPHEGTFADLIATYKADTLEELAEKVGIADTAQFLDTVKRYNELVAAGTDEDFGKNPDYLAPIAQPPFYGIRRWVRVSAILGGVNVDEQARCLNVQGEPIEGLYAIGNCAGGFYGGIDYKTYVNGMSIGRCVTSGYLLGKQLAQS